MKKPHPFPSLTIALAVLFAPLPAYAEAGTDPALPPAHIVITEIQTGAAAAGDEFVELYNPGEAAADITGWQVRYINAAASGTTVVAVIGAADAPAVLPPHGYFVLHTADVPLATSAMGQVYAAKLSASDKAIGLFMPDPATCKLTVADAVAWGASTYGEGSAVPITAGGERLLQRYRDDAGTYVDSDDNAHDFVLTAAVKSEAVPQVAAGATPGTVNAAVLTDGQLPVPTGSVSSLAPLEMSGCTLPVPPAAEETAEPDTVPEEEPPVLLPPDEEPPATIVPTEEENILPEEPPITPSRLNDGLKVPQITEMLPNPASPKTDAADELIELYNSNDVPFYLEGFVLETGLTTKRKYTFPSGAILAPRSFTPFFSADTHIALSNTGSQVRLLDPAGNVVIQSEPYGTAKDGQAWALAAGKWYWTLTTTPGEANIIKEPAAKKSAQPATTATKKQTAAATAVKGAAKTAAKAQPSASQSADIASDDLTTTVPFHTGVLAVAALFALLYGAYEYRRDIANKIHQFRSDRAARRADRGTAERR